VSTKRLHCRLYYVRHGVRLPLESQAFPLSWLPSRRGFRSGSGYSRYKRHPQFYKYARKVFVHRALEGLLSYFYLSYSSDRMRLCMSPDDVVQKLSHGAATLYVKSVNSLLCGQD